MRRTERRWGSNLATCELPAEVHGFVTHTDGEKLAVPHAIIRCCENNTEDNKHFESQLLERHSKEYLPTGEPKLDIAPVTDIVRDVLVVEDTPFLLDSKEEWTELLQILLRDMNVHGGRGPVLHDGVHPVPCQWKLPKDSKVKNDALNKDWAYVVKDIELWKDMFTKATD